MLADRATQESLRKDWVEKVRKLIVTVADWAERQDWATRKIVKEVEDPQIGNYVAPALLLQHETVRLFLEPTGLDATGQDGFVDFYRMPYYDDIASLYCRGDRWYLSYLSPEKRLADRIVLPKAERFNETMFNKFSDGMKIREI